MLQHYEQNVTALPSDTSNYDISLARLFCVFQSVSTCFIRRMKSVNKMHCPRRNKFCFVCGLFVANSCGNITKAVVKAYEGYFKRPYVHNLWYAPEVVCNYCLRCFYAWNKKRKMEAMHILKYVMPTIWLPRNEHSVESCYFCVSFANTKGFTFATRDKISYAHDALVIPARLRSKDNPFAPSEVPTELQEANMEKSSEAQHAVQVVKVEASVSHQPTSTSEIVASPRERVHHLITNEDYNKLIQDSDMSPKTAKFIASRFMQWNLVAPDFRVAWKRSHTTEFDECFASDTTTKTTYCRDVLELFQQIGYRHVENDLRLFIASSEDSLKAVLLNVTKTHPSVPLFYVVDVPENYENMKKILGLIKYDEHMWKVCCDLKIASVLSNLHKGLSKQDCFLCTWDRQRTDLHYTDYQWPSRMTYKLGQYSVDHVPLVEGSKIMLPSLCIKLGIVRDFVRAMYKDGMAFKFLKTIFPTLSAENIYTGQLIYVQFS